MIPKETVSEIYETLRIEEVVGDYVSLKKRGADFKACCPFHNEKTPSFSVSATKGIYKCFGCGEGGNAVDFVMKHEHLSYVEALKKIASKYGIEIEERKLSEEEIKAASEKESLQIIQKYALEYFAKQLKSTEGQEQALSYLQTRQFNTQSIEKFLIGYNPKAWDAFTSAAISKGYQKEFLLKLGLSKEKNDKLYDGYRGRLIFPIRSLSGACIGFGGRILEENTKAPKYVNSPETALYVKNKVLYGLFESKRAIAQKDNCYLVEGYTDVIAFHQAGIENVVASSGTSLTDGQIKLMKRFTSNVTVLYDGDVAGIKASFRGIDLLLSGGMNVKVVLFPEGDDPDSMAKKLSSEELLAFVENGAKDFILFKSELLRAEAENNPIEKASLIHSIIASVALIDDQIKRTLYIQQCANVLNVSESLLVNELSKVLRKKRYEHEKNARFIPPIDVLPLDTPKDDVGVNRGYLGVDHVDRPNIYELDILRLYLNYGDQEFVVDDEHPPQKIKDFLSGELLKDELHFENELVSKIAQKYLQAEDHDAALRALYNQDDTATKDIVIDLTTLPYALADWERKNILVQTEDKQLKRACFEAVYAYKSFRVSKMIKALEEKLKDLSKSDLTQDEIFSKLIKLKEFKRQIGLEIGRPI